MFKLLVILSASAMDEGLYFGFSFLATIHSYTYEDISMYSTTDNNATNWETLLSRAVK